MFKQAISALALGAALIPALNAAPADAATIVIQAGINVPPPAPRVVVVHHQAPPPRVVVIRHEERHWRPRHEEVRYVPQTVVYEHDRGRHEGWRR